MDASGVERTFAMPSDSVETAEPLATEQIEPERVRYCELVARLALHGELSLDENNELCELKAHGNLSEDLAAMLKLFRYRSEAFESEHSCNALDKLLFTPSSPLQRHRLVQPGDLGLLLHELTPTAAAPTLPPPAAASPLADSPAEQTAPAAAGPPEPPAEPPAPQVPTDRERYVELLVSNDDPQQLRRLANRHGWVIERDLGSLAEFMDRRHRTDWWSLQRLAALQFSPTSRHLFVAGRLACESATVQ
jgi:hypothetical protein